MAENPSPPAAEEPKPGGQKPAEQAPPTLPPPSSPPTASEPTAEVKAPPEPDKAPPPPSPNKFKKLLRVAIPLAVLLVLVGAGFGAYQFFFKKKADTTPQNQTQPSTVEASEGEDASSSAEQTSPCISGYKPYTNQLFSICIPKTMDVIEEGTETPEGNGKRFTFSDAVAELTVLTDFKENLNKFTCATSKVVKVSGFQAQRYLIKSDGKTPGSCSSTIKQYATLVSSGPEKPLFYIGMQKKDGVYQSDNGGFVTVDQSFFLNQ